MARTVVEILDRDLEKIAEVKNLYPLNKKGDILRYSKELSDWGKCTFRVSTKDPFFDQFGDIITPHVYNIRINRGGTTVWSGAIVDNSERNRNYIEVVAYEYDFYLDKVLIRRDAETTVGDGKNNYRTFKTGTMATAVTSIINSAKTDFGPNHPLENMTIDTIENPVFPDGFTNSNGASISGQTWTFSDFISLQFDYHTAYYVIKAFGLYTSCDFEINQDLEFSFKRFIGNKQTGVVFEYGTQGNIVDYNVPRLGSRMANSIWGIAADSNGKILHSNQRDETAIQTYGLLQDAIAFSDVKDKNMLKTRLNEQLQFVKTFRDAPINVVLNEKAYPLGQYGIGDLVTVKIKDNIIDYNEARRIVGISVTLHNTGREMTTIQTNAPRAKDMGI